MERGSPNVNNAAQRDNVLRLGGGHVRRISQDIAQAPTSPIGPSLWSPSHGGGDDGWDRGSTQQAQEAFQAMNLGISGNGRDSARSVDLGEAINPASLPAGVPTTLGDEPDWVTNLVGAGETKKAEERQPGESNIGAFSGPTWTDPYASLRAFNHTPVHHPNQYLNQPPPFNNNQGQFHGHPGQFSMPFPGYMNQPFNPGYNSAVPAPASGLAEDDPEVVELAKAKGLNPSTYDCRPPQARFFVIKSYTEEDVQKSLKHGIWSSTVLGNKRLNTAYHESADQMPIYLFFSVNGSRHFCGVAQMLTRVDETKSSDVWSENNKWKGIFKVKWIFVRDVPSTALRHIRLINTPEQKPITNSRDTQELHYEAGCEVLHIFLDHATKSKTSLLQDYGHYERLSASRPPSAAGQRPRPGNQAPRPGSNGPPDYPQTAPAGQASFAIHPQMPIGLPAGAAEPYGGAGRGGDVPPVPPIPARYR